MALFPNVMAKAKTKPVLPAIKKPPAPAPKPVQLIRAPPKVAPPPVKPPAPPIAAPPAGTPPAKDPPRIGSKAPIPTIARSSQDPMPLYPNVDPKKKAEATPVDAVKAANDRRLRDAAVDEAKRKSEERRLSGEAYDPAGDGGRSAAVDEAKRKSKERRLSGEVYDPRGVSDLARIREEQAAERAAQAGELARGKAKDLMDVDSRTGAAGMGLSGATAALRADVSRVRDRSDTLAKADLGRRQRDEGRADRVQNRADRQADTAETRANTNDAWQKIQRQAILWDMELSAGEDLDGDGIEGNPGTDPADREQDEADEVDAEQRAAREAARAEMSGDGGDFSPYTGTLDDGRALADAGVTFDHDDARLEGSNGNFSVVVRGGDGKLYKLRVPDDAVDAYLATGGQGDARSIGAGVLEAEGL